MNSIRLNKANNKGVIDNTLNGKSIPQNNRIILISVLIISVRKQKAKIPLTTKHRVEFS